MSADPVVTIKSKFKADELDYVSHSRKETNANGVEKSKKVKVPILNSESSDEEFLYMLAQFKHARSALQWDDGDELAENFRSSLQGSQLEDWDELLTEAEEALGENADHDEAWFDDLVADLLSNHFESEDWENMQDYLRHVKKPMDMSPKDFERKCRHLESIALQLPDAPNSLFTLREKKRNLVKAMPSVFEEAFEEANISMETESMIQIRKYFQKLWKREQKKAKKGNKNQQRGKEQNNSSNSNSSSNNNGNRGGSNRGGRGNNRNNNRGGRGGNRGNNSSNRNRGGRIQAEDPCPLPGHEGHTWGSCFQNANNPDRPQRNRNNNNNNNRGRNESNAVDNGSSNSNSSSSNPQESNAHDRSRNRSSRARRVRFEDSDDEGYDSYFIDDEFFGLEDASLNSDEDDCEDAEVEGLFSSEWTLRVPILSGNEGNNPTNIQDTETEAKEADLAPRVLARASSIGGCKGKFAFKTLLDSGGTYTMINARCIPKDAELIDVIGGNFVTTAGSFDTRHQVEVKDVVFPEFSHTRKLATNRFFVFDSPKCPHDIIFGRNSLAETKMILNFAEKKTSWHEDEVPFHPPGFFRDNARMRDLLNPTPSAISAAESFNVQASIKDAVYEKCDTDELADSLTHLTPEQREDMKQLFREFELLFSGRIGTYPHRKFHFELKDDAKPYHCGRPYKIPQVDLPVYKKEMDRQVELGLAEKIYESEWGFPGFTVPKANGQIRTVDDFRQLNARLKRRRAHIPTIQDMLERRRSYKFLTLIDISMQYYTFELDEESSKMCVIVTPMGMYRRTRVPMGALPSADWAQATMNEIFDDMLDEIEVYFDDILRDDVDWDTHLNGVREILKRLEANGFTVNPLKCQWAVEEAEWMGYLLTPPGYKPSPGKISAILKLAKPTHPKQLRRYLGFANYNKQFYQRRAHVFAPLTELSGIKRQAEFLKRWGPEQDKAWEESKQLLAQDVLLYFPDPNLPFDLETDASDYQVGAVLKQQGNVVGVYSRKLTGPQRRYPTIDKELLGQVEGVQHFRGTIKGCDVRLKTDHKNNTYDSVKSERRLLWRLFLDEYGPQAYYKGDDNEHADFFSRHPILSEAGLDTSLPMAERADAMWLESLVNTPVSETPFPFNLEDIAAAQLNDGQAQYLLLNEPAKFEVQTFEGHKLVCRKSSTGSWKIVIPEKLVDAFIEWYHAITAHGGQSRTREGIETFFYYPKLRDLIKTYVESCDACQRYKTQGAVQGEAPPRDEDAVPWSDVAVDLVGPWTIHVGSHKIVFSALTSVDVATTLFEIARIDSKTSQHVWDKFRNSWLSRYPRPIRVIHDQGGEFIGQAFQDGCAALGIATSSITSKNPQANAVCERAHGTIKNMLRTLVLGNPPTDPQIAYEYIEQAFASATYASRVAVHRALGVSPGALSFHRDMLLPLPVLADYELVRQRRQSIIDSNARRENARRIRHDYNVDDMVLVSVPNPSSLQERATGPFRVTRVHTNGTVTIERTPNVYERINIRRVRPYRSS